MSSGATILSGHHPLWRVGFRPFFAVALLAGALLPTAWMLLFAGIVPAPTHLARAPLVWHAHEMLFGFAGAMLAGFLLTASKNWVGIRGWHGGVLMLLVALWLLDRVALAIGGAWPEALFWPATLGFPAVLAVLLLHTLIVHRATDTYRAENGYFIVALPLFVLAKALLLSPTHFAAGVTMTLALFRLAFLLMLERTLTQFMSSAFKRTLPRSPALDHGIRALALLLVAAPWLPAHAVVAVASALALLIVVRAAHWAPRQAFSRLDVGIMMLGKLAIAAHLLLVALDGLAPQPWLARVATHVFTLGAIGCIVPAMIVRIAKGHTGRKVAFDAADRGVLWLAIAALALRVLPAPLAPDLFLIGLWLAAACWLAAFGLLAWRYLPFLWAPRIDGREH